MGLSKQIGAGGGVPWRGWVELHRCRASDSTGLCSPGHWGGGAERCWRSDHFHPQALPAWAPRVIGEPGECGSNRAHQGGLAGRAGSTGVASTCAEASEPVSGGSSVPACRFQVHTWRSASSGLGLFSRHKVLTSCVSTAHGKARLMW